MITSDDCLAKAVEWVNHADDAYSDRPDGSNNRAALITGCAEMAKACVELHHAMLAREIMHTEPDNPSACGVL